MPGIDDAGVLSCHTTALLVPAARTFALAGQSALFVFEAPAGLVQVLGIGNLLAGRQHRQVFQAQVNADAFFAGCRARREPFFDHYRHEVAPGRVATNCRHFRVLAGMITVPVLQFAELRQHDGAGLPLPHA